MTAVSANMPAFHRLTVLSWPAHGKIFWNSNPWMRRAAVDAKLVGVEFWCESIWSPRV
jgi:hypothetical protein